MSRKSTIRQRNAAPRSPNIIHQLLPVDTQNRRRKGPDNKMTALQSTILPQRKLGLNYRLQISSFEDQEAEFAGLRSPHISLLPEMLTGVEPGCRFATHLKSQGGACPPSSEHWNQICLFAR